MPLPNRFFLEAIELYSPEQWPDFLDQACGDDEPLRTQVEKLLCRHRKLGTFHEPVSGDRPTSQMCESVGSTVGPYTLVEQIGEGGMGVVYRARQTEPIQRSVALKVIKPGMDSETVVARFQAERQALALMDHPHIAKVYEAGTTDAGRPFFVMELVKGIPITDYCDGCAYSTGDRLELFVQVCQAINHAHERGIIHRDIKPSNVLIEMRDGVPSPKIIDFGVAKAMGQRLTEQVLTTGFGQMLGTPLYMSPEQAEMSPVDVDVRSDVYSLGVLLYQLLTGTPPFDEERLRTSSFDELRRIIREEDPPRPSTRLSTLGAEAETIAEHRRTQAHRLERLLRGDLDWIVMKALEKDPRHRYESANALAADVQRSLDNRPTIARPPSLSGRAVKWSRRHTALVMSTAVVLLMTTLSLGASTTWVFSAYQRESQVAAQAQAVLSFLTDDVLAQADPANEPDRDVKLRTVLDRAAQEIDQRFGDSPLVKATILLTLGKTYLSLGEYAQADHHLQAAADIYQQHLGDEHPDTLRAIHEVGELRFDEGRLEAAERLLGDVLQARQRILGAEHPETLDSLHSVGRVSLEFGQLDAAARLFSEVLQGRQTVLGDDHPATLAARLAMSECMLRVGQVERAQRHLQQAQASLLRSYGPQHPQTLDAQYRLASIDLQQDRLDEAIPALQSLREQSRQSLGAAHPFTLRVQSALARGYLQEDRLPDAEHLGRQTLDTSEAALGAEHRITTQARQVLADVLLHEQRFREAETQFLEVLECELRTRGHGQPSVLAALQGLNTVYEGLGLAEEATQAQQMVRSEAPLVAVSVSGTAAPWRPRTYSQDVAAELTQQQTWVDQQPWFIDRFVPPGSLGLDSPRGMTFGPDGHLYISCGTADTSPAEVRRYEGPLGDSPGAPLPAPGRFGAVFVSDGSGGLNNPQGLKFGPDGHLYVANTGTDSVLRYHGTTGRFLDAFIPAGSGGLDEPSDLAFRPGGLLYVASRGSDEVLRFNAATGAFVDVVVPAGSDGLESPAGLAFDAEGSLYVSSGATSRVMRYGTESRVARSDRSLASVASAQPAVPIISVEDVQVVEGNSGLPVKMAHRTNGGPTLADNDNFGSHMASLGDLDGDGIEDLGVVAVYDGIGGFQRGAVHVLFLNADGTVKSTTKIAHNTGGGPMLADGDWFGSGIASLGDLDGDGVGDLAVGARSDNTGGTDRGAVYVLFLNADGTVKSRTKIAHNTGGGPMLADGEQFGSGMGALGDLDGDGITELAVGAIGNDTGGYNRGAVHVLFLNANGMVKSSTKIASGTGGGPTLADSGSFGASLSSLGDLDGDSITDLAVGATGDDTGGFNRGAVHMLFLNADGTVKSISKIASGTGGGPTLADDDHFGKSAASLGDLDGDGITDLVVAAHGDDTGGNDRGAAYVLFLNTDGTVKSFTKIASGTGGGPMLADGDTFGQGLAWLGDLAVGARADDTSGMDRGAVYVLKLNPEGTTKGTTISFTVTRAGDKSGTSSLEFTTSNGTAIAGSDYTSVSGTVQFQPGETVKMITVPVNGDTILEPDETFFVVLSNPTNATLASPTVQATIHDDDSATSIAIDDASRGEGDTDTTQLVFTVTRSGDTTGNTTVDWCTKDGTAIGGSDYRALAGTIGFPDDDGTPNTVTVFVPILGDTAEESHETFLVRLSNPAGGSIVTPQATGTILNDETYQFHDELVTAGQGGLSGGCNVVLGPDGDLYVASTENDSVLRYDGASGAFVDIFTSSINDELDAPSAMAFGPDGNLYVAGRNSGNVLRFDGATGALIDEYVPAGGWGLQRPRSLTFGPDGQLYVVCSETDSIHRYDQTTGRFVDEFVPGGSGGLVDPWDLAFHDGHLYVTSQGSDSILQYAAATGAFERTLIAPRQGGLAQPRGLLFGTDNDLYVACAGDVDAVLKFEASTGRFLSEFIPGRGADYALDDPCDLTWGDADQLFVSGSSPAGNVILLFDRSGRFVEETFTAGRDEIDGLLGLAYHPSGRLFVTSVRSNSVSILPLQDEPGSKAPRFSVFPLPQGSQWPFALAFDSDSNLYVSCYGSHEILRYGPGPYAVFKGRLATREHRPSPLAGERR